MTDDCVFCGIIDGRLAASVVYDDERVVAFMDLNPVATGHQRVVPRAHAPALADLDPADGARMFTVAQRLAAALRRSDVRTDGVNLFLADGEAAGQEVFHAHLHVLPRHPGDGFRLQTSSMSPSRTELDAVAAHVRDLLDLS